MNVITRAQWGARETGLTVVRTAWSNRWGFMVHYSAANKYQTVRAIQDYHIGKGYGDIGYNFLVDYKGNIYEGRKYTWDAQGAHAINYNTSHIGVCFVGTDADVTDAAKRALRTVYDEMNRRGGRAYAKDWHGKYRATSCPGPTLTNWCRDGMPGADREGDDMFSDDDRQDLRDVKHVLSRTYGDPDIGRNFGDDRVTWDRKLEEIRAKVEAVSTPTVTDEQLDVLAERVAARLSALRFVAGSDPA